MALITYRDALNQALREELRRDPNVFLMGEEVGVYQGAYKVSKGLLQEFGPQRIIDTPITEEGFAGVGVGAAMAGLRPIIEMMTWNFSLVAIDQIVNGAAKMLYMSGGQFKIPMVFRGPGGAAHQLAAQHSQSLEAWYASVPGLKVVAPSTPYDAKGLLKSAIRDDDPVIFMEGETLYGAKGEVPDEEYVIPIGVANIKREGTDVTIIAWSKMVTVALKAAEQLAAEGISCEIVDPRVILEEGWPVAGLGAQLAFQIQRDAFGELDAPVTRVTGADVPMPYAKNLEHMAMPSPSRVVAAVREVLYLE
jgi:pyruvate dehydrogenase E1 component beta subunit